MLAAALYVVTALVTAAQVYWLLAWGMWGAPTTPLQYVSLGGSLVLLIAGIVAKWKARASAFAAVGACVAIWCFYAPAVIHTLRSLPTSRIVEQTLWAFTPVVLLVVSSVYAVTAIARTGRPIRIGS
jgi:hypothetical protein